MASTTPSITIIGSLNVDFVTSSPRVPGPGETLTATSLSVNAGGKGANQAVACGRASFPSPSHQDVTVRMIGAVGANDPYYATLLQPTLATSGVCTQGVQEMSDAQTGSATILVDEGANGENRILVVPGANHAGMSSAPAILSTLSAHRPDVAVLQGEIPRATVLDLLRHFNDAANPTQVVFNPAPVFPEGVPREDLQGLAVLVMNETEAAQLSASIGGPAGEELELERLAAYFHDVAKVGIIIVTLGAAGVFFSTASGKQGSVTGVKVAKVVDTTAAGDTFVGFFATAFAKFVATGEKLEAFDGGVEEAVRKANAAAAICVQTAGAMKSVPFAYECL